MHEAQIWAQKMPSGKRQLRSASSESRNTASPLASGTYVRKETPGGLQSRKFLFQNQRVNVSMVLIKMHMHHQFFGYCRAYFGNFLKFGIFDHCLNWSSKKFLHHQFETFTWTLNHAFSWLFFVKWSVFDLFAVRNIWTVDDRKNGKNGKTSARAQSPLTLQSVGNHQNRPSRGASQHQLSSGSPLVMYNASSNNKAC